MSKTKSKTPDVKVLRDYQDEGVQALLDAGQTALVAIPTGGGKSEVLRTASLLHPSAVIRILVTVSKDVEAAFQSPDQVVYSDTNGDAHTLDFADVWLCPREEKEGNTQVFLDYIADPQDRILVTTHSQFRRWESLIPKDTSGWLLSVDEIHHSGKFTTLIAKLGKRVVEGGGDVWGTTATPVRTDGRDLFYQSDVTTFMVPYSYLALHHGFPQDICFKLLEVNSPTLSGSGAPLYSNFDEISAYIANLNGPTVLYVPPGDSSGTAKKFRKALKAAGFAESEIVDAVNDEKDFHTRLAAERDLSDYSKSTLKVIIACGRMAEASDWPSCCNIVTLGVTTSLLYLLQRLGRGLRPKTRIKGHPSPNTTTITMFVGDVSSLPRPMEREFAAQLLTIACHLQAHQTALTFAQYFEDLTKGLRMPPAIRSALVATLNKVDNDRLRESRKVIAYCYKVLGLTSVAQITEAIKASPSLSQEERFAALLDLLELANPNDAELRSKLMASFQRVIDKAAESDHYQKEADTSAPGPLQDLLWDALLALAALYEGKIVHPSHLSFAQGVEAVLTPARLHTLVDELEAARSVVNPYQSDTDVIDNVIEPFKAEYGSYPSLNSGVQDISKFVRLGPNAYARYTLRDLDLDLRSRGLTLDKLISAHLFGAMSGPPLTLPEVRKAVKKAGPAVRSLPDFLTMGDGDLRSHLRKSRSSRRYQVRMSHGTESLVGLEMALTYGWRGLPDGLSLASL